MDYQLLPSTDDPYLVFYMPASPDGHAFQAKVELRFLPAPGKWFLSISDAITGEDLGVKRDYFHQMLPAHGCRVLKCRIVKA